MDAHINKTVLMSGADFFDDGQAINPFMAQNEPIDLKLARNEHQAVRDALEGAGVTMLQVPPPKGCQDGIYTANWALVRGKKAVMARLPSARKGEEAYAAKILQELGKEIIYVPGPANGCNSSSCLFSPREAERAVSKYGEASTAVEKQSGTEELGSVSGSATEQVERCSCLRFSGQGDALPCGDYLLAGQGYRSDVEVHEFLADTLGYEVISLQTIPLLDKNGLPVINKASGWPDSFFYDIDLALSVLRPDLICWCPDAFTPKSQKKIAALPLKKIVVSLDEAMNGFACNLVSTGSTVIMSADAPKLKEAIVSNGLKVITPNIHELKKGGGFVRCITLTLDNS